jgi:hypothetical protein
MELEIKIPTGWNDVSLKKYLELQKEIKNYEGNEDAITALMLVHLCDINPNLLDKIGIDGFKIIEEELNKFVNRTDLPLERIITIDNVEYGFEPNLSEMTYGAYVDITKYDTFTIDDNWAKIMSILYRPIAQKKGDNYKIQSYTGNIDDTKWLEVPMDIHLGALFFFANLLRDLLNFTLNSLTEKELEPNMKLILEKNGKLIQRLSNLQEETFKK